jgi:hypothetical protein
MATPRATVEEATEYYAGEGASSLQLSVVMGLAAGKVQGIAPDPTPEDEEPSTDYVQSARNAELLVGKYLWETDGFISSEGLGKISTSYKGMQDLDQIVISAMGDYASGGGAGGDDGIAYYGWSPI